MNRSNLWILTVNFWPSAHALGRAGIPCDSLVDLVESPQLHYRPHQIYYKHRPTREDFLAAVRRTPWMQVWRETLLPIVETHPCPLVSWMHKSATVELLLEGRQIGRLDVRREHVHLNLDRHIEPITAADIGFALRTVDPQHRQAAENLIRAHEYSLMESVMEHGCVGHRRAIVIRGFLSEQGISMPG